MGVYIPPSIRTVREDIQQSVVLSGGQVVPAFIGKTNGKVVPIGAYQTSLGGTEIYTFPNLGALGPVLAVTGVRTQASGGILYQAGVDYVFSVGPQTIDWSADTTLSQPYLLGVTEQAGTSTLLNGTTYYWVVTALRTKDLTGPLVGETIASNEQSLKSTGGQAVLQWTAVTGAESYKVYRSTISGNYTGATLVATVTGGFSTTYTDTGTATSSGSPPGLATSAQVTAGNSPTYNLSPAQTVLVTVNGTPETATFNATRASRTGVAGTFPTLFAGGETLQISIDGGPTQTVVFAAGDQSELQVLNKINALPLLGGSALDNGGQIQIESDKQGAGSSVNIIGGTGRATLGLAIGSTSGTGSSNLQNIAAVTAAEVAAVITAQLAGTTGGVNGAGKPTITDNTTGATGTLNVTGGTATTTIGFPLGLVSGSNPNPATALRRPALHGGVFYVDYTYLSKQYFTVKQFTSLALLIQEYGLGSNLAIAGTLAMAGSGRGNNASQVLAMAVPDDNLFTYQTALDFLARRKDVDLVVPLAVTSGLANAVKNHCQVQSDVDHMRERIGVVGLDIGSQIGDTGTSGTAIFLANQMGTEMMIVVYPWPIIDVQQSDSTIVETELPGWALAAAVAGQIAALPDRAEPPTAKQVQGITRLGVDLDETEMNLLGAAGVLVVSEEDGNFIVRDAITTNISDQALQQVNIDLTDNYLRKTLRSQFKQFRGRKLLPGLLDQIQKRTIKVLNQFVKFQLIVGFDANSVNANQDPDVLTSIIVRFSYRPVFPARIIEFRYSFDLTAASLAA